MIKKVLKWLGIVFITLLVLLLLAPFLFKGKIEKAVKQSINEQLNATVYYGDVGISIFRSFPKLSLSIENLTIVGQHDFENDTLASIQELDIAVDLMSIIKSGQTIKVLGVKIIEPRINAIVLSDGKANWDIMKPTETKPKESKPLQLSLKKIMIKDAKIAYSDLQGQLFLTLKNLNFEGEGDFASDIFDFKTNSTVDELTYQSENIAYLKKVKLALHIDLHVDQIQHKYAFDQSSIRLNDLSLNFKGFVKSLPDAFDMDLQFNADKTDFKNLLSLIPTIYSKDFDKIKTAGNIELNGAVKGKYKTDIYPSFSLHAKIANAMFQYPEFPTKVTNINALVDIHNDKGGSLDQTIIHIPSLHLSIDNEPIDMSLLVQTPMSDPYVEGKLRGKIDLKKVPQFYPMEGLKKLEGKMDIDVQAKARMSQVQKEQYQNVYFAGKADITNLKYESKDLDWPIAIANMNLKFNPKTVDLTGFNANIGKSDFHATGSISNFLPYFFANDVVKGNLTLTSSNIDLNEISSTSSSATATTISSESNVIEIPANIDFSLSSTIHKLEFKKIVMTNLSGVVTMKDKALDIAGLSTELLGGTLNLAGKYDTKEINSPDMNFSYSLKGVDFQQAFMVIPSMEKLAPIAKYLNGIFTSDLNLVTKLNPDFTPDYNTLTGVAKVKIDDARLVNLPVIQKIAAATKLQFLNPMAIKNAWTELKFLNGRVYLDKPYVLKIQDYTMTIIGSGGFDKTIDYAVSIDVPADKLGNAKAYAQDLLAKAPIPGLNGILPEILTFNLKVGGTMEKPIVNVGKMTAGTNGKSIQQQATETVKEEAQKAINDVKDKAQIEAQKQLDLAKENAQKEIDKVKAAAQKQATDQVNKAKEQIKKNIKLPW